MSNNERCFLAKQYLRYIRLLDKCEYFNREESDEAMYLKIYNLLHTKKGIGNIICKLDYDFRCLPDEILKNLDGYPSFKGYCYTNEMLYAQIKIDDSSFTIPPIRDEKQMDC